MSDFIGSGIAFPLRLDASGSVALVRRETEIEEAIHLVLGTAYGERPLRPEFGCGIHDYVFAPADGTTAGLVAHEVRAALRRWEPRIDLVDVRVSVEGDATFPYLLIEVEYAVKGTNDQRNLVFPFYTIPEGEE
jgi:phage baseplate assembly protein W